MVRLSVQVSVAVAFAGAYGLIASGFQSPKPTPESELTAAEASKYFVESCSACHVAPDIAYMTDRAWVQQIRETA